MPAAPAPFISYSANGEDVILHRLFGGQARGVYVDVGAGHPTVGNATRALHDQGWSGINVEPDPGFFAELVQGRPNDANHPIALSDEEGRLDYWAVAGTGLSSCDPAAAARARARGFEVRETTVRCTTLARLLEAGAPVGIDLLRVAVGGAALRVLQGNDWNRFRPSVVLVDVAGVAPPDGQLRPLLAQNGYDVAHADGLNDFFVRRGFKLPDGAFRPPSRDDHVRHHATAGLGERLAALQAERNGQRECIAALEREASRLRHDGALARNAAARAREEAAQALEAARLLGAHRLALRRELELAGLAESRLHLSVAEHAAALRGSQAHAAALGEATQRAADAAAEAAGLRATLASLHGSTSWRLSRPLRGLSRLLGRRGD